MARMLQWQQASFAVAKSIASLEPGTLAVLERWLPNTVTILDRF